MCGIFAVYNTSNERINSTKLAAMGTAIEHRGPDDSGVASYKNIAVGNQRLAIIDVNHGQQPMHSEDGGITVVQNGEIFNFLELKQKISSEYNYRFHTNSDTEVILALYEIYGEDFVTKLNGMFSIAIIDKKEESLKIYRDRMGEKPLYIWDDGKNIIFASEIKSLLKYSSNREVSNDALNIFLQLGFVPPPLTMFKNIFHVMPGTMVKVINNKVQTKTWWKLDDFSADENMSEKKAIENIQEIMDNAVEIRMRSDVPFGAFLSGGIDSSYCIATMKKHTKHKIKTFNMAFPNTQFDEGQFAVSSAKKFGTDLYTINGEENLLQHWAKFIYHCDQPHADISFIPTMLLSELTSKHVKMVLTGDGADELFAGYTKYLKISECKSDQNSVVNQYLKDHSIFNFNQLKESNSEYFTENIFYELLSQQAKSLKHLDKFNLYFAFDCLNLLPGNNLVKPDRMGMAYSIEARQPFMDYRMIEHGLQIPGELKIKNQTTKYILKKATVNDIGEEIAFRKKHMFTVPVTDWKSGGLSNIAKKLLLEKNSFCQSVLPTELIKSMIEQHNNDNQKYLKNMRALISLEIWHKLFIMNYDHFYVQENYLKDF